MNRSPHRLLLRSAALLLGISTLTGAIGYWRNSLAAETARSADSFVDSICVASHWSYTDTPYHQRYAEVKQKLIASGIRNVRDGFYQNRPQDLGKSDIRMTIVADVPDRSNGDEKTIQADRQPN
ncbi:hypothetical protein K9N68_22215 [Kovacikia minuta CCNUW1]|uniref:hypothetical protein n=1 Tax=Kovacikia minuta TaxID=2931930 RepID=UPI001CCE3F9E|nr:hypothetical protein [Kovacikia minuta]UBF24400.1 hypothetical protein K9N68_22215 [Kovacikia minuta CCNUW1]